MRQAYQATREEAIEVSTHPRIESGPAFLPDLKARGLLPWFSVTATRQAQPA
jgi:hypothetical protein